ncbi:nonribosomal peptide synthetase MxaA [Paracoccus yeei]|uniref:Nonribosomal peptide synthetase MxaA n=1 Tax=Paracoccus yeei TaxID=147645 RepID=A0A1V0GU10_9RHOB|nr:nonribosomal peptide synthetase MxaA [Paracoccus yeei]ARC37321.1 nonribosomal peptide synthetase MxaA [Paracoccus yeei]
MKWLLPAMLPLAAAAQDISVDNPRGHGWWLGDELVQRVQITLPPGAALDPASLPRPRAVDYWLDLRDVTRGDDGNRVTLALRYQNFYSALEPSTRKVPDVPLRLMDGTRFALPGFSFVTSPIRPILAPSTPDQVQPDPPYHLIDTGPALARLVATTVALVAGLLALAWHQGWFPFHARPARPFTRAARSIRRLPEPQARRALHRAFDAAFGRVLIGADLDAFLRQSPQFAPLAQRLSGFFAASDAAFFGLGEAPPQDIAALARDLSAIERGRR